MIEYHPICISKGNHRFALEQEGENVLIVLGVNPSTADENKPDPTMQSVLRFVNAFDYDGYVMLNLSSERSTNPNNLSLNPDKEMHMKNLSVIASMDGKYPNADILLAFGNNIDKREYLEQVYFRDIYKLLSAHERWLSIGGNEGNTKHGHPRHPLYASTRLGLGEFDIKSYTHFHKYYFQRNPEPSVEMEWRWCLVGNVVKTHPFGDSKEERRGTKQFAPGAKVYCAPGQWGDGYEQIVVIGHPRHGKHLIQVVMPSKRIENFRVQKVFKPAVLNIMKQNIYRWWDNSDSDYELICGLARSINDYIAAHKEE